MAEDSGMTLLVFRWWLQQCHLWGARNSEQESQHYMISVSLSFLVTPEDFVWTLFDWPPSITRYDQLSPKAAKSPG